MIAYSSNIGAAHIATDVGAERQRAWLKAMGMFQRSPIELPGAIAPQYQPASTWRETTVMTVGFGHGIAIEPLQVVRGTAAVVNGGILVRPTILAVPPDTQPEGVRVMQESTSLILRKLMRLVVTVGTGKKAEVAGYYVGGKTGTAEKVGAHGYRKHTNVSAFISVFPMNAPRYAVYMMLDEPHGNKSTYGFSTGGMVAAPAAGQVIARVAPMLGLLPDLRDADAINQALAIPLQPMRPPGAPPAMGPGSPQGAAIAAAKAVDRAGSRPAAAVPVRMPPHAGTRIAPTSRPDARPDPRHEAAVAAPSAVRLLPVSAELSPDGRPSTVRRPVALPASASR